MRNFRDRCEGEGSLARPPRQEGLKEKRKVSETENSFFSKEGRKRKGKSEKKRSPPREGGIKFERRKKSEAAPT